MDKTIEQLINECDEIPDVDKPLTKRGLRHIRAPQFGRLCPDCGGDEIIGEYHQCQSGGLRDEPFDFEKVKRNHSTFLEELAELIRILGKRLNDRGGFFA